MAPTLMDAQLDRTGGTMLSRQMEQAGIFVRTGRTVKGVYGDARVEGVVLDDGTSLPADVVVLACGVRPRVDVARASGLPVNRAIVINDAFATQVPGVLAFGECAEHRGRTYGIVTPVWEQAEALAGVLSGVYPPVRYTGSKVYTRLKVAGMEVASMGRLEPELDSDEVVQVIEERKLAYRKMILRDGRLLGAMLVGNATAAAGLLQMFDRNDLVPADPLEALCSPREPVSAEERVVCNCNRVTERVICDAIAAGACSVEAVGDATRAGTGCGSCRTELKRLIGTAKRPAAVLEAVS
jgi:nitrite reductase (NADH) large subunit